MSRFDQVQNTPTAQEKRALFEIVREGLVGRARAHASRHVSGGGDAIAWLPAYPRTLSVSQTIPDDWYAEVIGPITIPEGVTVTLEGTGYWKVTE